MAIANRRCWNLLKMNNFATSHWQKNFRGGRVMEILRRRNSTNKPRAIYQWRGRRRTAHAPRDHFKGMLYQKPRINVKNFEKHPFVGKFLPFQKFQAIFVRKNLCPGPHLALSPLSLNVNQRSKELWVWWLVSVGVFSQNQSLMKNTLAVSCLKIQERGARPLLLPLPMHMIMQLVRTKKNNRISFKQKEMHLSAQLFFQVENQLLLLFVDASIWQHRQ